jgi:hypothetical protein
MNLDKIEETLKAIENNGYAEIGIAAGTDAILSNERKLAIKEKCFEIPILIQCALTHLVNLNAFTTECKRILVSGVYAIFLYDLVNLNGTDIDTKLVTEFGNVTVDIVPSSEDIKNALNLIMATKVNFYSSNHHTGQTVVSGFPAKVSKLLYPNIDLGLMTDVLHVLGHWCNTSMAFKIFGLINKATGIGHGNGREVKLLDDFKLRLNTNPAGTAKLGLCYAALNRLRNTPLIGCVPNVEVLQNVVRTYKKVMSNRIAYHINAGVISGEPREIYDDNMFDSALAILATFTMKLFPNSSINKSPIISGPNGDRYKDLEGYNVQFEKTCIAYMRGNKAADERMIENFETGERLNLIERGKSIEEELRKIEEIDGLDMEATTDAANEASKDVGQGKGMSDRRRMKKYNK